MFLIKNQEQLNIYLNQKSAAEYLLWHMQVLNDQKILLIIIQPEKWKGDEGSRWC